MKRLVKMLNEVVASTVAVIVLALGIVYGTGALAINSDAGRVMDSNIDSSFDNCTNSYYAPFILNDPSPVITGRNEVMYTMGNRIFRDLPPVDDIMAEDRVSDVIHYSYRKNGKWTTPVEIINKSTFPWMSDESYIKAHPAAYVGAVASPYVQKVDGMYIMAFTATINDINICAGNHAGPSPFGSCTDPFSYFVTYLATSFDGINWTLAGPYRNHPNAAIAYAAFYYSPSEKEKALDNGYYGFSGISSVNFLIDVQPNLEGVPTRYAYFPFGFWSSIGQKNGIVRVEMPYNYYPVIKVATFEQYSCNSLTEREGWYKMQNSSLHKWFNEEYWRGAISELPLSKVSPITEVDGYKWIMTQLGSSMHGATAKDKGLFNQINYRLSNDMVHWTDSETVVSKKKFFADGTSYDSSVIDPIYYEEPDGTYSFYFATADDDLDGRHDCSPETSYEWLTAVFIGTGIYQGTSKVLPVRMRPARPRVNAGNRTEQLPLP